MSFIMLFSMGSGWQKKLLGRIRATGRISLNDELLPAMNKALKPRTMKHSERRVVLCLVNRSR